MKIKTVQITIFLALATLLLFQAIWLYNSYSIEKSDLEKKLSGHFVKSVEKEVKYRFKNYFSGEKITFLHAEPLDYAQVLNKDEVFELGILQQILKFKKVDFDINLLDSILHKEIKDDRMEINYILCYKDSADMIIDQAGNLPLSKIDNSFHTEPILIIDGKKVTAILDTSPSVIFKQMIWVSIGSFLMLLIISYCIFYQAKLYFALYKLNIVRNDFVHALTHDMKTPLATINTVLVQFRNGSLDDKPEIKEKFGFIAMDQISTLLMLVEKMLTIAKSEQSKLTLEYSEANIPQIVQQLSEGFSVNRDKKIIIRTSFILNNEPIYLDTTLIKNAIANLIENSIKYSGSEVEILIDCYIRNRQLFIRVIDNGFGIPEKDQSKIFEKFERGVAARRQGAKGFGLGLNYVKYVAEAHKGIVTLFSNEEKGSEFTIILPIDKIV